jgi:hypothetical protein
MLPKAIAFDGGMLLVADAGRLLAYNSTAHRIWCAVADGQTPADISASLVEAFQINPTRAAAEVDAMVSHWRREGLFEPTPDGRAFVEPTCGTSTVDIDWARSWTCRIGNHLVEMAVQDAAAAELLAGPLPPDLDSGTPETRVEVRNADDRASVVLRAGRLVRRVTGPHGLKEAVYEALLGILWPERTVDTLIHAGAVVRRGMGLCFAAASGSGKSTLVGHLCGQGADYLTDDFTALDPAGELLPLPTAISVKEGSWARLERLFPELRTSPSANAGGTRTKWIVPTSASPLRPAPLRALIFPTYIAGCQTLLLSIRPFDALLRLREAGVWLGHPLSEERVTRFVRRLESTPAYSLDYDDLAEAATAIDDILHRL